MEGKIKLAKTFRYFTYGNPATAKNIWFVLHGYGQLPNYFIRKFHCLDPTENFVVAPEGMHRFYLEGTSGRVGASWMTKEAREDDISDNINYLDNLQEHIVKRKNYSNKILLGFSQGGATAARWHEMGNLKADQFILWASIFPPDLLLPKSAHSFMHSKNLLVVGDNDPYFNQDELKLLEKNLTEEKIPFELMTFNGKHEIDANLLKKLTP